MICRRIALASFGLWLAVSATPVRADDPMLDTVYPSFDCAAPAEVTRFKVQLSNTARAIRRGKGLTIVAIGSSSTEGIGASDRSRAYPAQLAAELKRNWPKLAIEVINKGVGGEDAQQMLQRFETDVLPYKPQLVIWQVGSNYTLRNSHLDDYADIVRKGINQLKAANADVILMDLQYAPKILDRPLHRPMIDTVRAVGNDAKVAIFRRFAVMRHWISNGSFRMEDIISRDHLHMNDISYGCIGRLLAHSVVTAVAPTSAPATAAHGGFAPSAALR